MASYKITLSASSWTQTRSELYWDTVSQTLYADSNLTEEISAIEPPTRECYQFNGYYQSSTAASPGNQYIDETGNFTSAFLDKCATLSAALTIYVNQTEISKKITLNLSSGTGDVEALYYQIVGGGLYTDNLCEGAPVLSIPKPKIANKAFRGFFANATSSTSTGTQYIDKDGNFLSALTALTAAKTIYAWYLAPYKITISANSGTGGSTAFYYDSLNGLFYDTADVEMSPITKITPHTRSQYKFLGIYASNNTTSAQRVAPDGTIAADFVPTAAATVYAQWQQVSYKLTINKGSGTGGTDALYCSNGANSPVGWYLDDLCQTAATRIEPPTRSGYAAKGVFTASTSGTKYINRDGTFTADFVALSITAAKTYYWQWGALYKITLNRNGGQGGPDEFWYSSQDDAYFADDQLSQQITSIEKPTSECFHFDGYYSASSGGTQYIDSAGQFTAALSSLAPTAAKTFYAHWTRVSYKLTLNDNGGTGGSVAIYNSGANANYYADDQLTTRVLSVNVPTKTGYSLLGYYQTTSGGSKYVNADGTIAAAVGISANTTIFARYTPNTYTLFFSEGSTTQKTVTFGAAVGAVPSPTKVGYIFAGWYVDETKIEASTVWNFAENKTAYPAWIPHVSDYFGNVEDYFNLGSASMIPIASDSGDNRTRLCVAHTGKYERDVNQLSGVWRNPSVTYAVVRSFTFRVTLGKAYAAQSSGNTMYRSGYMITEAEVATSIGNFPTITVRAVANEGRDAINLFDVSVPVVARSKAQNLMNAIRGGGKLSGCTLVASCEPVVVAENMMPCASDVVNGKITVNAGTIAPTGEAAPTAQNGFTSLGEPKQTTEQYYAVWNIAAEKELN